jgi:hypothetical protein
MNMRQFQTSDIADHVYEKFDYNQGIKFTLERLSREGKISTKDIQSYYQRLTNGRLNLIALYSLAEKLRADKPHWSQSKFERELTGRWSMNILNVLYDVISDLINHSKGGSYDG